MTTLPAAHQPLGRRRFYPAGLSVLAGAILFTLACRAPSAPASGPAVGPEDFAGTWRAVLASPGGELPFTLQLETAPPQQDAASAAQLRAVIHNAEERLEVERVVYDKERLTLYFDGYDSEIVAQAAADGQTLTGRWRKTGADGDSVLPFTARRGQAHRFFASSEPPQWSVAGSWAATFTDEDGDFPARGEFAQDPDGRVTGTFRTTTGDYRYLEGEVEGKELYLSTFDGAHAFLFQAELVEDGDLSSLSGDFYSRDSYHATFTARPAGPEDELPDGWLQVGLTNSQGRFAFAFPDLDGKVVSSADERFTGKVVLVDIFGSWCPNCNDSAPILAAWARRYRDRGLEVVGLAFEITGDPERDARFVRRFAARHAVDYPLLLAGTSDKQEAGARLPDLEAVLSFPTKVFIDRRGKVRHIHSGFDGPGTGTAHTELLSELEAVLEELLDEPE